MVEKEFKIDWSDKAKASVKRIFDFYKGKSLESAKVVKKDIINSPKKIVYSKQYQIDDVNSKYRRIVVRNFKVLYREEVGVIYIMNVVSTLMDPKKQLD